MKKNSYGNIKNGDKTMLANLDNEQKQQLKIEQQKEESKAW